MQLHFTCIICKYVCNIIKYIFISLCNKVISTKSKQTKTNYELPIILGT